MRPPESNMTLHEYRRLALMALWTGLIATLGLVFVFVPNIELVMLTAFLGGVALGIRQGVIVAILGEAIFSALNPIGSGLGFPILYAFQILAVGLSGFVGALSRKFWVTRNYLVLKSVILGFTGFSLTLIYDMLTALSMPLSAGITEGTLWGSVFTGLAFFIMHLVSNTILFALFALPLIFLVQDQILMHGLATE